MMENKCQYKKLSHQFFGNLKEGGEDEQGRRRDDISLSSKCWPCVDLSDEGKLIKLRASSWSKRGTGGRIYYARGRRRQVGDAPIGRQAKTFVRCLVCYRSLSGREKVCTVKDIRKTGDERHPDSILPEFVNLLVKGVESETITSTDADDCSTEVGRLKTATMKLAVKKPRVYLCSTCSVATQRFVRAHELLKMLGEQVFEMRAKFISAIKLSDEIAFRDDLNETPSRKIKVVTNAVSFLRKCIINGECAPEMDSEAKRPRRSITDGVIWDVKEVLADLITSVEEMEKSEAILTCKLSPVKINSVMPQLKCEVLPESTMLIESIDFDDHSPPELEAWKNEINDIHFAEDGFTEQDYNSPDETLMDHDPFSSEDNQADDVDELVDVPSSSIFTMKKEAFYKPNTLRKSRRSKTGNKPIDNSTDEPEFLVGKDLSKLKTKEKIAKLKSKYPGITYDKYQALQKKRAKKLQKCTNDGLPGRASLARKTWINVPVKKVVAEDGEVRLFFKNVEIKKMEDGLFYCGICGQSRKYRELSYAKTHINLKHIDLSNGFECEYCGRKFYYNNKLEKHLAQSHHVNGKNNFQCEICGELFATCATRYSHKRVVHDGFKPHTCEYCGKSFGRVKDMTIHVRRHTGEKPFVCHVCAFAFVCQQTMKAHIMRKHPEAAKLLPPSANPSTKGRKRKVKQDVNVGD